MSIEWFEGICWYLVFLMSLTAHEAAHAWAALRLGDDTAYRGGQVTLDPTPHIKREPLGMVAVPLISYILGGWMIGWASAPYNPEWAFRHPKKAAWMAMAGPAANLVLFLSAALVMRAGLEMGWFHLGVSGKYAEMVTAGPEGMGYLAATLLSICFSLNLLLFVFNLIPLPPLDGGSIPLFFLSPEQAASYMTAVRGFAIFGIFISWKIFPAVYLPLQSWIVGILLH